MTSRYWSPFPERKVSAPQPPKDKRSTVTPKADFKKIPAGLPVKKGK